MIRPNGVRGLCCVTPSGKQYACDGYYAAPKSIICDSGGVIPYDEEKDEYFFSRFYFIVKNWDDFSSAIEDSVTHWMPLPRRRRRTEPMRTINEIKSDFRKPDADFAELMDELFNTVARDIPFSRFEICHAERDGRCVVLPCKVGDAIYPIDVDRDLAKPPFRITGFRFRL